MDTSKNWPCWTEPQSPSTVLPRQQRSKNAAVASWSKSSNSNNKKQQREEEEEEEEEKVTEGKNLWGQPCIFTLFYWMSTSKMSIKCPTSLDFWFHSERVCVCVCYCLCQCFVTQPDSWCSCWWKCCVTQPEFCVLACVSVSWHSPSLGAVTDVSVGDTTRVLLLLLMSV